MRNVVIKVDNITFHPWAIIVLFEKLSITNLKEFNKYFNYVCR